MEPKIAKKEPIVIEVEAGTYWWCTCGESSNQPYCDGSHKGTDFTPRKIEIEEAKKVAWCQCKHTSNPGFCDGTHAKL